MSLQNRVTPFGNIIAASSRGLYTGNRGIIHFSDTKRLHSTKRWTSKAWIYCLCDFNGKKRDVFGSNGPNGSAGWTNLFFSDEATALAAGHRPCFYCQRERAKQYQTAFSLGSNLPIQKAPEIDARLHGERLSGKTKRMHPIVGDWRDLPSGTMITKAEAAYLVFGQKLLQWSFSGYRSVKPLEAGFMLLTPPSSVSAMANGFQLDFTNIH